MRINRSQAKQIISTYAAVLFEAASADGTVDAVGTGIADAVRTVRAHAELRETLLADYLPAETRGSIAREVFASMPLALTATLGVMAERGEFALLLPVAESYAAVAEERRNLTAIEVITAVELTDALRSAIANKFSADLKKNVVLQEKVDPSIIGGIIINAHGKRLDASIASQLAFARATLSTVPAGGDA